MRFCVIGMGSGTMGGGRAKRARVRSLHRSGMWWIPSSKSASCDGRASQRHTPRDGDEIARTSDGPPCWKTISSAVQSGRQRAAAKSTSSSQVCRYSAASCTGAHAPRRFSSIDTASLGVGIGDVTRRCVSNGAPRRMCPAAGQGAESVRSKGRGGGGRVETVAGAAAVECGPGCGLNFAMDTSRWVSAGMPCNTSSSSGWMSSVKRGRLTVKEESSTETSEGSRTPRLSVVKLRKFGRWRAKGAYI
ncbi:hypothetical protein B0H12DRAFT_1159326 [Mycena haematopus]|nr:hypothetical protein B0H12DRAFT_1159326 [Mycena haematopus]